MYTPKSFLGRDTAELHSIIRRYSFATLFSWSGEEPVATHLPFLLDTDRGPHGTLICHMARANPHWRSFNDEREVLVAFLGPHAYVSPSWYVSTGNVPTWNYAAVHAYGVPRMVRDAQTLLDQVLRLAAVHEPHTAPPWNPRQVEALLPMLLRAIVGIEIPIVRLEGKLKFNQNLSREDRASVIAALEAMAQPMPMAMEVAALMRQQLEDAR